MIRPVLQDDAFLADVRAAIAAARASGAVAPGSRQRLVVSHE